MGSHSYLVNLDTNIHDLQTSGLLNSHASITTTTNVGHMHGDRSSVITLGLEELSQDQILRLDHLPMNEFRYMWNRTIDAYEHGDKTKLEVLCNQFTDPNLKYPRWCPKQNLRHTYTYM